MKKVIKTVTVNGNKIRVVMEKDDSFQAQVKSKYRARFRDYGPSCETEDHAFFWAFDAIGCLFQDQHQAFKAGAR